MAKKKVIDSKDKTKEKSIPKKQDDKILFAFLAAFLSIVGFIIALIAKRKDKYVMYYAKLSLVIFIIAVIVNIIGYIINIIPVIGWVINAVLSIIVAIAWILSWVYALSGKEKEILVISKFAEKINL